VSGARGAAGRRCPCSCGAAACTHQDASAEQRRVPQRGRRRNRRRQQRVRRGAAGRALPRRGRLVAAVRSSSFRRLLARRCVLLLAPAAHALRLPRGRQRRRGRVAGVAGRAALEALACPDVGAEAPLLAQVQEVRLAQRRAALGAQRHRQVRHAVRLRAVRLTHRTAARVSGLLAVGAYGVKPQVRPRAPRTVRARSSRLFHSCVMASSERSFFSPARARRVSAQRSPPRRRTRQRRAVAGVSSARRVRAPGPERQRSGSPAARTHRFSCPPRPRARTCAPRGRASPEGLGRQRVHELSPTGPLRPPTATCAPPAAAAGPLRAGRGRATHHSYSEGGGGKQQLKRKRAHQRRLVWSLRACAPLRAWYIPSRDCGPGTGSPRRLLQLGPPSAAAAAQAAARPRAPQRGARPRWACPTPHCR
jgi:hypothetical protein